MTFTQTHFLDSVVTTLVRGGDNEGRTSLQQFDMPAGQVSPLHRHRDADEGFFLLSGHMTLWAGAETVELSPGSFFNAPRGVPHAYRVHADSNASALVMVSPAGFEDFVESLGTAVGDDDARPRRPDPAELIAAAERFGIEILGPPGTLPSSG